MLGYKHTLVLIGFGYEAVVKQIESLSVSPLVRQREVHKVNRVLEVHHQVTAAALAIAYGAVIVGSGNK